MFWPGIRPQLDTDGNPAPVFRSLAIALLPGYKKGMSYNGDVYRKSRPAQTGNSPRVPVIRTLKQKEKKKKKKKKFCCRSRSSQQKDRECKTGTVFSRMSNIDFRSLMANQAAVPDSLFMAAQHCYLAAHGLHLGVGIGRSSGVGNEAEDLPLFHEGQYGNHHAKNASAVCNSHYWNATKFEGQSKAAIKEHESGPETLVRAAEAATRLRANLHSTPRPYARSSG